LEEVWRVYDGNRELVAEYDTNYDFQQAWDDIVAKARNDWTWRKACKWERVPAPVRGKEEPLKRFT
jgi:hypothetical protein